MDQVKFVKDILQNFEGLWLALSRPCSFKFFKCCFPQILLGPFFNTFSHITGLLFTKSGNYYKKWQKYYDEVMLFNKFKGLGLQPY